MTVLVPTKAEYDALNAKVAGLTSQVTTLTSIVTILGTRITALEVAPDPTPSIPPVLGSDEPIPPATGLIMRESFDAYTAPQNFQPSDTWWPWLVPSEPLSAYGIVPGRGGGKALQLNYTGYIQGERHLWITHPEDKVWYSPANAAIALSYGFRIHKNGGPGGSPGYGSTAKGMKWFELWRVDGSDRGQFGPTAGNAQTGPLFHFHPAGSPNLCGFQPVGPYWNQLNDAQWHRATYLIKPAAVRGDLTGIAQMWVDGQKIVDVSAPAIGVTPPNGTKAWCTDADVRSLDSDQIGRLQLGEYMNGTLGDGVTDLPMTLEFDDFAWWLV